MEGSKINLWPQKNNFWTWAQNTAQLIEYLPASTSPWVLTSASYKPGMVIHTCNLNTWNIQAGGF